MHDLAELSPELTTIKERLVVAPITGRFHPLPPETFTCEGEWVERGQILGTVDDHGRSEPIVAGFNGWVMGMLAVPGQPITKGEVLFWIRGR